MKKMRYILILIFILPFFSTQAQDFVYQPINPAFGGNFYNYQWLLSSANAQNKITEKQEDQFSYWDDPLKDFENTLNRQILDQLSRQIIGEHFGETTLEEGEYQIGNYQIDIGEGTDGVNIHIFDASTGGETSITIPYF